MSSYAIFTDLGNANDNFTVQLDQAAIENRPYLFEHTFILTAATTGKTLRFKLQATNERGSTTSARYLSVLMARRPNQPS